MRLSGGRSKNTGGSDGGKADQSQACQSKEASSALPPSPPPVFLLRHHSIRLCRVSVGSNKQLATTRSMPPTAKALTFLEMLARFSSCGATARGKANAYRAPEWFRDLRRLDEQRPPESRPYLTTRSYGSTKGLRSAHIGLGRAERRRRRTDLQTCAQQLGIARGPTGVRCFPPTSGVSFHVK